MGEGAEHDRMDGFSHDGFHSALAGWDREGEPRQRAGGRVDATGAPIGPASSPLARVDGWVGGLSGQHSTRFSREGQEDGRSRSSLFRSVATPAHWNRDQADREKAGRGGHPQDGSRSARSGREVAPAFGWGERAQYGLY